LRRRPSRYFLNKAELDGQQEFSVGSASSRQHGGSLTYGGALIQPIWAALYSCVCRQSEAHGYACGARPPAVNATATAPIGLFRGGGIALRAPTFTSVPDARIFSANDWRLLLCTIRVKTDCFIEDFDDACLQSATARHALPDE